MTDGGGGVEGIGCDLIESPVLQLPSNNLWKKRSFIAAVGGNSGHTHTK
jgi:hypothetical protein